MLYHTKIVIDIDSGEIIARDLPTIHAGNVALCDKANKALAQNAAKTATSTGANYGSDASSVSSTLVPELRQEATAPQGFSPTDLNAQLVAGEQGAGGAASSLAGTAGLGAARSRNTGALSGVLDEVSRNKGRQLSENALNVQSSNAQLKEKQRQEGLSGLEGVYGTDVGAQLKAQGLVPEDIGAANQADQTGWGKDLMNWINTLTGSAKAGAAIAGGGS